MPWLDRILAALPFLAPVAQAIASAFTRTPVPEPAAPTPPTVDGGDGAALSAAQARAAGAQTK